MFKGFWLGMGHGRERLFEKGDLKYVILDLLKEKPSHGYEIIRALEERFGGLYTPSPGAVYPTLQMLEDLGYVAATQQDSKRVYAITDEGRKFLVDREHVVDDIWARMSGRWGPEFGSELHAMRGELKDLVRLFARTRRAKWTEPERMRRIREVVTRARHDIEAILAD